MKFLFGLICFIFNKIVACILFLIFSELIIDFLFVFYVLSIYFFIYLIYKDIIDGFSDEIFDDKLLKYYGYKEF